MLSKFSFLLLLMMTASGVANPRTVMVQLFEWPWADVAQECETYLGPNGFAAVQVSPPEEHISIGKNAWWERYQPVSYKLISRSGDEFGFRDMVKRCKSSGVDIYVDVVLNHMAEVAQGQGFGGTYYTKYNHLGLYDFEDFHHCGKNGNDQIVNYKDRYEVQYCELLGLSDLKTESEKVQQTLAAYLNRLLSMGVVGFRLDAAKHIPTADLKAIFKLVHPKPYIVSEAFIGLGEPISLEEYLPVGDVNLFQYSFDIGGTFTSGRTSRITPGAFCGYPSSTKAVVFLENHDLQRTDSETLASYVKFPDVHRLATVFMLTWPYGYPQIFSGFRFMDFNEGPPVDNWGHTLPVLDESLNCRRPWTCEHRLPGVAALAQFRNFTDPAFYASGLWHGEEGQIAFSRGHYGFVAINRSHKTLSASIPAALRDGVYCNILDTAYDTGTKSCQSGIQVRSAYADIILPPMSALVLQSNAQTNTMSPRP